MVSVAWRDGDADDEIDGCGWMAIDRTGHVEMMDVVACLECCVVFPS
jgi:hypothetical protein